MEWTRIGTVTTDERARASLNKFLAPDTMYQIRKAEDGTVMLLPGKFVPDVDLSVYETGTAKG